MILTVCAVVAGAFVIGCIFLLVVGLCKAAAKSSRFNELE